LTDAERAKAASAAWVDFVRAEIRTATMAVATAIGETTRDALAERDQAIEDLQTALAARDRRIEKLEIEVSKLAVGLAKAEVKLAQAAVDRDRERRTDFVPPPSRREMN
ncbi:MAG TPA: hypothetical protein VGF53_02630, partial [Pseudolabrys sp.]